MRVRVAQRTRSTCFLCKISRCRHSIHVPCLAHRIADSCRCNDPPHVRDPPTANPQETKKRNAQGLTLRGNYVMSVSNTMQELTDECECKDATCRNLPGLGSRRDLVHTSTTRTPNHACPLRNGGGRRGRIPKTVLPSAWLCSWPPNTFSRAHESKALRLLGDGLCHLELIKLFVIVHYVRTRCLLQRRLRDSRINGLGWGWAWGRMESDGSGIWLRGVGAGWMEWDGVVSFVVSFKWNALVHQPCYFVPQKNSRPHKMDPR